MILTFGEALLRFSTPGPMYFSQAGRLDFFLGGSELNVAVALACQGLAARWVSCLPDREIGDLVLEQIRRTGVDTGSVLRADGRMGYYLLEEGAAPRPSRVIERQKGVLGERTDLNFDWDLLLTDATWFHTSGITAGLSAACRANIRQAAERARARGIPVSYDFNFRRTVWSIAEARELQRPLLEHVDVLFCSAADIGALFEVELPPAGQAEHYAAIERVLARFKFRAVVLSERSGEYRSQAYGAVALVEGAAVRSNRFQLEIVDRIGAGDALAAGFIRARLEKRSWQDTIDFAAYCAALKHTVPGDFLTARTPEPPPDNGSLLR